MRSCFDKQEQTIKVSIELNVVRVKLECSACLKRGKGRIPASVRSGLKKFKFSQDCLARLASGNMKTDFSACLMSQSIIGLVGEPFTVNEMNC